MANEPKPSEWGPSTWAIEKAKDLLSDISDQDWDSSNDDDFDAMEDVVSVAYALDAARELGRHDERVAKENA